MKLKQIFDEAVELTSISGKTEDKIQGWCATRAWYCKLGVLVVDQSVDVTVRGRIVNDEINAPKRRVLETVLDANSAIRRVIALTDEWKTQTQAWATESTFKIE